MNPVPESYDGLEGLERLKAHMRVAFAERKQGLGVGWSSDYFRGWLFGLSCAGALDAAISLAAHRFINERGYE